MGPLICAASDPYRLFDEARYIYDHWLHAPLFTMHPFSCQICLIIVYFSFVDHLCCLIAASLVDIPNMIGMFGHKQKKHNSWSAVDHSDHIPRHLLLVIA